MFSPHKHKMITLWGDGYYWTWLQWPLCNAYVCQITTVELSALQRRCTGAKSVELGLQTAQWSKGGGRPGSGVSSTGSTGGQILHGGRQWVTVFWPCLTSQIIIKNVTSPTKKKIRLMWVKRSSELLNKYQYLSNFLCGIWFLWKVFHSVIWDCSSLM